MDIIVTLFKYFSKFVKKEILQAMLVNSEGSQQPGYAEIEAEILNQPDDFVIDDIDMFVFSTNEKFVSDRMKNVDKISLFVEYGAFAYDPTKPLGVRQKLAVHVAFPYSMANNDNLNETLLMNRMHNVLCTVLDQMEADQTDLEFCGTRELINFPAEIVPIEPMLFYDRSGWMAIFDHSVTNMQ